MIYQIHKKWPFSRTVFFSVTCFAMVQNLFSSISKDICTPIAKNRKHTHTRQGWSVQSDTAVVYVVKGRSRRQKINSTLCLVFTLMKRCKHWLSFCCVCVCVWVNITRSSNRFITLSKYIDVGQVRGHAVCLVHQPQGNILWSVFIPPITADYISYVFSLGPECGWPFKQTGLGFLRCFTKRFSGFYEGLRQKTTSHHLRDYFSWRLWISHRCWCECERLLSQYSMWPNNETQ